MEKGKLLFDESNLPIIKKKKKEIYQNKQNVIGLRFFAYICFIIPGMIISVIIFIFADSLVGKIFGLCLIIILGLYPIIDIIVSLDNMKDLKIYEKGITIPDKPFSYILKRKNWFVPFSKIDSVQKDGGTLIITFKDNFSKKKYISLDEISDWSKFKSSLEGKVNFWDENHAAQ